MWSQEKYTKAWFFAAKAHKHQKYPATDLPYIVHIGNVAMEVAHAIIQEPVTKPDLAIICALLHDTIEDTEVTYEDILQYFGTEVANGVLALSKDSSAGNKKEQMLDSLERIKKQPKEVWLVKLADRISNLGAPPAYWKKEKIIAYHEEAKLILKELKASHFILSKRLQKKIDTYLDRRLDTKNA